MLLTFMIIIAAISMCVSLYLSNSRYKAKKIIAYLQKDYEGLYRRYTYNSKTIDDLSEIINKQRKHIAELESINPQLNERKDILLNKKQLEEIEIYED